MLATVFIERGAALNDVSGVKRLFAEIARDLSALNPVILSNFKLPENTGVVKFLAIFISYVICI
jgi:hypothetical protein